KQLPLRKLLPKPPLLKKQLRLKAGN
ncbi:uncharacterized protein METZ01_LOCUS365031, partial [marine metagenome]